MLEIIILSVIQGITEFLPVSSSSHLIIFSKYLNFENQNLSIDVSLHIGSFIAVLIYFRIELFKFFENKKLFFKILISSIPVMFVGFIMVKTNLIDKLRNIEVIGWMTLIFGILLYYSDNFKIKKNITDNFNFKEAMLIGLFQILSLIPGVSRSGIAITAARLLKFKRVDATKISFLLSIPILAAVTVFGGKNLLQSENFQFSLLNLFAIMLSFLFSFITINYFLKFVQKFNLKIFSYYRILLGIFLLAISFLEN
jgi:undecaprenyl-diphosphatase